MPKNPLTAAAPRPFIDYYNAQSIIPVRQDTQDMENFLYRRNHLYTTLGVPLGRIKNIDVIEFGPGGGFNALATNHFGPASYIFVDATKVSIKELNRKKEAGSFGKTQVEIVESDIFEYQDKRTYDLVLCEGVLPCQNEPRKMLKHVASFCNEGGILFITTMSATSLLSEICRRVLRPSIMTSERDFAEQTRTGADLFRSHLQSLGVSTRPAEDWVQDTILNNDWQAGKYLFTMPEAVETLTEEFDFYSSSPSFLIDDRWYKRVGRDAPRTNDLLKEQYGHFSAFLLDGRIKLLDVLRVKDAARIAAIEPLCKTACAIHDAIISEHSYHKLDAFIAALQEIIGILPEEFNLTKHSISDFIKGIRPFAEGHTKADFGSFAQWWGMGQQYVSFVRRV